MSLRIVNEATAATEHRRSPGGAFELLRRHLSLELGGVKDIGRWGGGHPFDVELATIPAGKKNFPLHAHAAQTEYYIVVSGCGQAIDAAGQAHAIRAGDHFIVHPGKAHQLAAAADEALSYFVIADNHPADITSYPRTGKRQLKPEYRVIEPREADYYAGEE